MVAGDGCGSRFSSATAAVEHEKSVAGSDLIVPGSDLYTTAGVLPASGSDFAPTVDTVSRALLDTAPKGNGGEMPILAASSSPARFKLLRHLRFAGLRPEGLNCARGLEQSSGDSVASLVLLEDRRLRSGLGRSCTQESFCSGDSDGAALDMARPSGAKLSLSARPAQTVDSESSTVFELSSVNDTDTTLAPDVDAASSFPLFPVTAVSSSAAAGSALSTTVELFPVAVESGKVSCTDSISEVKSDMASSAGIEMASAAGMAASPAAGDEPTVAVVDFDSGTGIEPTPDDDIGAAVALEPAISTVEARQSLLAEPRSA